MGRLFWDAGQYRDANRAAVRYGRPDGPAVLAHECRWSPIPSRHGPEVRLSK
jgi:hypothetical protein